MDNDGEDTFGASAFGQSDPVAPVLGRLTKPLNLALGVDPQADRLTARGKGEIGQ